MTLLDGPSYGTRIVEEIEARAKGRAKLYPANLFRRIRDLMGRGLIEECARPEDADPRRTLRAADRAPGGPWRGPRRSVCGSWSREAAGHDLLPEG